MNRFILQSIHLPFVIPCWFNNGIYRIYIRCNELKIYGTYDLGNLSIVFYSPVYVQTLSKTVFVNESLLASPQPIHHHQ